MGLPKRLSRASLRWRILVPFLVVSLSVSFVAAYVLGRSLESQIYRQADQEATQQATLVAAYLEREQTYIVSQLALAVETGRMFAAEDATLIQMMTKFDPTSVMRLMGFGGDSLIKTDLVKIIDVDGRTALNLNRDLMAGGALDDAALIARALEGSGAGGIVATTDGRNVYLVGAARFAEPGADPGTYGLLMLGREVDQEMLAQTGLSERLIFAYTDEHIAACNRAGYRGESWRQALKMNASGRVEVDDAQYVLASAPIVTDADSSPARVAVAMSMDAVAAKADAYWTRTWLIYAAGALVLVIAGFAVARRVVSPIQELTTVTEHLKKGDFDIRSTVTRGDEIGQLAGSFNTMGQELKARDVRLAEAFDEVKRLSETDALTGLLNHRMINERLTQEVARAQRYGSRFGLMIIDLDDFKLLNDTHGHPVGDEALRQFSRLLIGQTREVDAIGRHGGDEFMVVLPECGPAEIAGAAEKLQAVLAKSSFRAPDGSIFPMKMSLGLACYPEDGEDANTLVAIADANLYLSKSRGGGTVTGAQLDNLTPEDMTVFSMLGSLVTIVDNKDRYTRHHSEEVTKIAMSLGDTLGLSDESQRVLRVAGLLHDIGKIGVPDRILRKPGRLTDEEYDAIKQHTLLGDAIVAAIPDLDEIRAAILAHHERYDGAGYPNALKGDEIPILARILAVADAFSAMVTDRPYRKALTMEEAAAELLAGRGGQFDPDCVDAFMRALESSETTAAADKIEDTL